MGQIDLHMTWRRWLLLAVFTGLTILVLSRFTNFSQLRGAIAQSDWPWLVVAVVVHAAYFVMYAELYKLSFDVVGVQSTAWQIVPVLFSGLFINTVVPSGGTAGGALFIADASRRGQSGARAAVGTVLVMLIDLSTLIPFLIFGLVFLATHGLLRIYDTVTSAMFGAFIFLMIVGLVLAERQRGWLRRILEWLRNVANHVGGWFKHPNLVGEDWPEQNARDLAAASGAIVDHPLRLLRALAWAFLLHIVNLAGLYVLFVAFHQPVELGALVAGFTMGIVFFVINVLPQGVAAVEGIMALVFVSAGISSSATAAIVLSFRAVNFYLPIICGFFLIQYLARVARSSDNTREKSAAMADPPGNAEEVE